MMRPRAGRLLSLPQSAVGVVLPLCLASAVMTTALVTLLEQGAPQLLAPLLTGLLLASVGKTLAAWFVARRVAERSVRSGMASFVDATEEPFGSFPGSALLHLSAAGALISPVAAVSVAMLFGEDLEHLLRTAAVPFIAAEIAFLPALLVGLRAIADTNDFFGSVRRVRPLFFGPAVEPLVALSFVAPALLAAVGLGYGSTGICRAYAAETTAITFAETAAAVLGELEEPENAAYALTQVERTSVLIYHRGAPLPAELPQRVAEAFGRGAVDGKSGSAVDLHGGGALAWAPLPGGQALVLVHVRLSVSRVTVLMAFLLVAAAFVGSLLVALLCSHVLGTSAHHLVARIDALPEGERVPRWRSGVARELLAIDDELERLRGRFEDMRRTQDAAIETGLKGRETKSQFFAGMSHDLRSPLNSVIGFTDLLLKEMEGALTSAQHQAIEGISRESEKLMGLIADILDSSKLDAGRFELDKSWVPSVEILTECLTECRRMLGSRGTILESVLQPGLPPLNVDKSRVRQALITLVSRAVEVVGAGTVKLQASCERLFPGAPRTLKVDVIDPGHCVTREERQRIAKAFRAAQSIPYRSDAGGLGLSLALARDILQLHGGELQIFEDPESRTLFCAFLPLDDNEQWG